MLNYENEDIGWFKLTCKTCGDQEGKLKNLIVRNYYPNSEAQCPKCKEWTHNFYSGTYYIQEGR